ncbi:MAG: lipid-A-disaccharide synthase [Alphaproteobacteria bacterium]|nr:lipid-A-disaccharide synthase [Alphaproteobacteria bacterium]
MKVYLIAGEPSGDLLGSRLMRAMVAKNPEIQFYGIGGETMQQEGLNSLFDISELAVMGLFEVLPSLPKILKRFSQTVEDIKKIKPDVVITIDSWSFSSRIHKLIRKKKIKVLQVHYVAPQVWAWKKKRAKTMYKYIDHLLTLFPYEPKYFTPHKLPTTFVGHPVIESSVLWANGDDFRNRYNIDENARIMAVLPGSRHTEVSRLLPVFLEAVKKIKEKYPEFCFVIPTVATVEERVKNMIKNCNLPIIVVNNESDRHDAFCAADVAIAASGTVALELAMVDTPHIIAYKLSAVSAWLAKHFLKIQFVNLSNILLGREIVPELLQENCNVENIIYHVEELLKKQALYERQMQGFSKVKEVLGLGEQTPSANACDIIFNLADKK